MTRQVEDRLSDALHERLASRFVDRRTSVLMRRLRENAMLEAEVTATGDVLVEGQHVGSLFGFRFVPDATAVGQEARALTAAALKALTGELESRAAKLSLAADDAFILANDGLIRWTGEPVARLEAGEKLLAPRLRLISDEHLSGPAREQVENRLNLWLKAHVTRLLGPLLVLEDAPDLTGMARGIAFQIAEALGVLDRARVADEVKGLEQEARAALRKHGVRFGAYHLYLPALLKPAPRALAAQLWALKHGGLEQKGRDDLAHLALSGRTSIPADKEVSRDLYRAAGFRVAGERALRVDILERLADLIRPAIAYRPGITAGEPPAGSADGDGFVVTPAMTSLIGAAGADFAGVLKALGYQVQTRPGPAITVPLLVPAPTVPVAVAPEAVDASAVPVVAEEAAEAVPIAAAATAVQAEVDAPVEAGPVVEAVVIANAALEAESAPVAGTAPDAEAAPAADAAVAAVEMIEVWRPARRHEHRGDARGRPRGERGGERAHERGGEGRRRFGPRPDAAVASTGEGAPRREGDRKPGDRPQGERGAGERREGRREEGRRDERRDGPRTERPRRDEGRRDESRRDGRDENRGPRPERGREGGRRDQERRAPMVLSTETKPRGERQPDPNSPFAKLAALKAQMDAGRK
jgi:ATP-dependent RNA helicase SUPV3L1/SUV3